MKSTVLGAIYGAFVADALSLGAHWVYDVDEIKEKFPSYDGCYDPVTEYHGSKKAGDFTHYGDQTAWLLESIALDKEFSLASFAARWKAYMSDYDGYIDGASKTTLENLNAGLSPLEAGSSSQELSVVGRIAPLALLYCDKQKEFEDAAVLQARMTHNSKSAVESARFFSQLLYLVFQGYTPKNSLLAMLNATDDPVIEDWIKLALASVDHGTIETITSFGQSCNVKGGAPSALHLILKYENNYEEAMKQNILAGGDSAARGMVAGMVLGAYNKIENIPQRWIDEMSSKERIASYIEVLDE